MVSIFTYNIAVANIDRGHCDVIKRLHGGLDCCHSCWLNIFLCFNFHNKSCCTKDDAQKYDPKNFPDFAHFVIEICEPVQCCLIAKFWETFQVIFSRHFEKMLLISAAVVLLLKPCRWLTYQTTTSNYLGFELFLS